MRGVLAQEIHHRVKNNLQTVASLLRLQARGDAVDPRRALDDSVNRILAIAAVHEVLTERRDESVDLGELLERLRAMLVQGLGAGKDVDVGARVGVARGRLARPRSRSSSPSSSRTRSSTAAARCGSSSRSGTATSCSRSPTTAPGSTVPQSGPGSSIVEALVRDELGGTLSLATTAGCAPRSSSPPSAARGRVDDGSARRAVGLVADLRRILVASPSADEPRGLQVLRARASARAATAGQRRAKLGEAARLVELGEHRQRPFLQADLLAAARAARGAGARAAATMRRPPAVSRYSGRRGGP